ncbi:HAD family hydrolase [Streptomyces sp. URMC 126]|uniref:HAD family hydrolase n=1 Tax=Streptomyces sp. URMC 126 TaxID=3423401 RepID=UPI003F1BCB1C
MLRTGEARSGADGRLIVLDFDGVLLDTERIGVAVWRELLREAAPGLRRVLTVRADRTLDRAALARRLAVAAGRRQARALWDEFERRNRALADRTDAKAGVRSFLAYCRERGHTLAVASGNAPDWVEGHLGRLGLRPHFTAVTCAGPGVRAKPAPDAYLRAVAAARTGTRRALAVEDSYAGLAAARAAGLPAVWVTDAPRSATPPAPAARRVRHLGELVGRL